MNILFKHSKKIVVMLLMMALILTANIGLICSINNFIDNVGAKEFTIEDSVSISNSSFVNNDTSGDYPYSPNNFTFSSQVSNTNVNHGVVNLNETTYKNNYIKYEMGKDENPKASPSSEDNYVLMINSRDGYNSCGYTSNEFTFSKAGNFYVSAYVYTDNIDGAGSLYLFNGSEVVGEISAINTHKTWKKYYFFITTSDYESLNLSLGLWQGSKTNPSNALVLFDEVSAGQISKDSIYSIVDSSVNGKDSFTKSNSNYYYKSFEDENLLFSNPISNQPFTIADEGNTTAGDTTHTTNFYTTHTVNSKVENVFQITNHKPTATCFETDSFTLMANKTYKFSVKVKVEALASGSAYLKLVEVDEENESPKSSESLTISTTSNKFESHFIEYSIYVQADPTKSKEVKLQLGLGETGSTAEGIAYFKDYKISSVPYSEFKSASSSTAKTLDFSADYAGSSDVSNFAFNLSQSLDISKINEVKINKPTDWTINNSSSGYSQTAGVFNVKDFASLNKEGLTNIANPGYISKFNTTSNNVLMLHNEMSDVISATSSSFSLTKNSYYEISVWVQTQVSGDQQSGASILLNKNAESASNLVLSRLDNVKTNGAWQEISFYIQTGYEDLDVTLTLSLGNEDQSSNGYAFFDNIFAKTSTEDVYTTNLNQNPENVFDLKNPLSANGNLYFEGNSQNKLNTTRSNIINVDSDLSEYLVSADYKSARDIVSENRNILAIHSTIEDDYYTFNSLLNYSLTSGSYYKLSVDVYTAYLKSNNEDFNAGASIGLTNIEDSEFKTIKSDKKWTTYTFYISPDQDVTTQLSLALGNSEETCHGTVLFGNIIFEEIADQETYLGLVEELDSTSKTVGDVIKEDEETAETEKEKEKINWAMLVSTLTAVAVVVAVFGIGFKKLFKPGKKRYKKSKVEYDRTNSVIRQKYRKLAYLKREKDIRTIEKQLSILEADKLDKEDKYKQLLSKVREVKMANRDGNLNKELSSLNNELNKASKNVSRIGISVNKLINQIALMKTEGYLLDLERRLTRQDELAKSRGSSIEEILKNEDDIILIEKDESLDEALLKADKIIEEKKEEEKLKAEEAERLRLEEEKRIEEQRIQQEARKAEEERLKTEAEERAKLEDQQEKQQVETTENVLENETSEAVESSIENSTEIDDQKESTDEIQEPISEIVESETQVEPQQNEVAKQQEVDVEQTEDNNSSNNESSQEISENTDNSQQ